MAEETEGSQPDWEVVEETEGGPVKSFLDHLEDLRWTLIKVTASLAVAMLACLIGANYIVKFLTIPLETTMRFRSKPGDTLPVHWGTNVIARFARTNLPANLPPVGTNIQAFSIVAKAVSNEFILTLQPEEKPLVAKKDILVVLKSYTPIDAIMVTLKLSLYGGLVLSLPFILYFIGQFVLPALKVKEKEFILRSLGAGGFLFLAGMAFCFFLMLPMALGATVEFSNWLGFAADEWRAEDYITFVCVFMLVMGVSFELPILLLALVKIGLLDYQKLNKFRAYWVVLELVICAFLTPSGDPFTMMLMALPVHILYEISLLIAWYWHWRDNRRAKAKAKS